MNGVANSKVGLIGCYTMVSLGAAGLALFVVFAPGQGALLVTAAGLLVAAGLAVRSWCLSPSAAQYRAPSGVSPATSNAPLTGRALYFAGALTIGLLTARPVAGLTVSDLLFLCAMVITLVVVLVRPGALPKLPPLIVAGSLLFFAGAIASSLAAPDTGDSLEATARVVYITVLWFWLAVLLLKTTEHVRIAAACWVAAAALAGFFAVAQVLGIAPLGTSPPGRFTGSTDHVNDLGGLCAVALPVALMFVARGVMDARRTLVVAVVGLCGVLGGLILSGSVGALVGAVAGALVWITVCGRVRSALAALSVVATLAAAVLILSPADVARPTDRLNQVTSAPGDPRATLFNREEALKDAIRGISAEPFFGVGLTPEGAATTTGIPVHNMLVKLWYEGGLLTLLGMLTVLAGIALAGLSSLRAARTPQNQEFAAALFAAYVAFIVVGGSSPILFQRYGWIAGALVLAAHHTMAVTVAAHSRPARVSGRSGDRPRLDEQAPRPMLEER